MFTIMPVGARQYEHNSPWLVSMQVRLNASQCRCQSILNAREEKKNREYHFLKKY